MSTEQVPILTADQAGLLAYAYSPPGRSSPMVQALRTIADGTATVIATAELEALRRDADRWIFARDNHIQFYAPGKWWIWYDGPANEIARGHADTYEQAIDAAMVIAQQKPR